MFSLRQDALLLSLRPIEEMRLVPEARDRRAWGAMDRQMADELAARAQWAHDAQELTARPSDFLKYTAQGDELWPRAYTFARERLKALTLGACARGALRYATPVADQLYAICESSDWSLWGVQADFPDHRHAVIDVNACETGALIAVSAYLMRDALDAVSKRICARVSYELNARLINPLVGREEAVWHIPGDDRARAAAALMTVALLSVADDRSRWLCMRTILRMLEGYMNDALPSGGFTSGLNAHLEAVMAVCDCFSMLSVASGGEVELRDEPLFVDMAHSFLSAHIDQGWFLNPGGRSMRPDLSCDLMHRLGESARLDALCGLAAYLFRVGAKRRARHLDEPTEPLLQQVMSALGRPDLLREAARMPQSDAVELQDMRLLAGRMDGFYAALTAQPGTCCDAGALTLFFDGSPVVINLGGDDPALHSVPVVGGRAQVGGPGGSDAEMRQGPGYHMLSMNVASAYPAEAALTGWQRTLMLAPFEGGVRLMEVFDLDAPGQVVFRFIVPALPHMTGGCALLGGVRMTFDERLIARVDTVPVPPDQREAWGERVYRLDLTTPELVAGGNFAFLFRPQAG